MSSITSIVYRKLETKSNVNWKLLKTFSNKTIIIPRKKRISLQKLICFYNRFYDGSLNFLKHKLLVTTYECNLLCDKLQNTVFTLKMCRSYNWERKSILYYYCVLIITFFLFLYGGWRKIIFKNVLVCFRLVNFLGQNYNFIRLTFPLSYLSLFIYKYNILIYISSGLISHIPRIHIIFIILVLVCYFYILIVFYTIYFLIYCVPIYLIIIMILC